MSSLDLVISSFNSAQKEAVLLSHLPSEVKNILIVAGAGSGKTRVLTTRIAYLLEKHNIDPNNIVGITFTRKAADEMKERVVKMTPRGHLVKLCTFHSLCSDLIKGFRPGVFSILDEHDQREMLKIILATHKKQAESYCFGDFKLKNYLEWLGAVRSNCLDPIVVSQSGQAAAEAAEKEDEKNRMLSYYLMTREYNRQKGERFLDFDDLIEKMVEILKNGVKEREALQRRWKYVLVDEYQDTNTRQFELLSLIVGPSTQMLQVGDEDQLLYSWRGAKIEYILRAYKDSQRDPSIKCVKLLENYRCSARILRVANAVISSNTQRTGKSLLPTKDNGLPVSLSVFSDEYQESDFIARRIIEWHGKGIRFDKMAILFRTNAMAMNIERALVERGVPYKLYDGAAMFDRLEVRLLINLLWIAHLPDSDLYVSQVFESVRIGVGEDTIRKWSMAREVSKKSWLDFLSSVPLAKRVDSVLFYALLSAWKEAAHLLSSGMLCEAVAVWMRDFPVLKLFKEEEREKRSEYIELFAGILSNYQDDCELRKTVPSLEGFHEQRLLNDAMIDPKATGKVHLMTLHRSKGLEFEVGIIPGIQDGLFPRMVEGNTEFEEEVRAAYVGITRFMHELLLTRAARRVRYPSVVLESSILDHHLPELIKAGDLNYEKGRNF